MLAAQIARPMTMPLSPICTHSGATMEEVVTMATAAEPSAERISRHSRNASTISGTFQLCSSVTK